MRTPEKLKRRIKELEAENAILRKRATLSEIVVTETYSAEQDPEWNYGRYINIFTNRTTLRPCCPKNSPCWECS